jgi:hypothetical protein
MTGKDIQSLGESTVRELGRADEVSFGVRVDSTVDEGYGMIFGGKVGESVRFCVEEMAGVLDVVDGSIRGAIGFGVMAS